MLETQSFVSATALMRGQILPPSEMKSLYGSTTSSAVWPCRLAGVLRRPLLPVGPLLVFRPILTSRFQNQVWHCLRLRYQRNVTCLDLDRLGGHSLCHEALEIRVDGPILRGHGVPAWL